MEEKVFVIFTLGPVQSFIARARRTQDLWAGSRLLSYLMEAALEKAQAKSGELVYPVPDEQGHWPPSLPNRAVLLASPDMGREITQNMSKAARGRWQEMADQVYSYLSARLPPPLRQSVWRDIWKRQINSWLETYWVVWPWDGRSSTYGETYRTASEMLEARKRLRDFAPTAEPDQKCTLCGERQALRGDEGWRAPRFWDQGLLPNVPLSAVRPGERLCAVDTVKRFADFAGAMTRDRFPSTSSVAAAPYRLALIAAWDECGQVAGRLFKALEKLGLRFERPEPGSFLETHAVQKGATEIRHYDGDVFYPEFYQAGHLAEALNRPDRVLTPDQQNWQQKAATALQDLRRLTAEQEVPSPTAYYAVLALDGDRLGRTIAERVHSQEMHQELSRRLTRFAREVARRIVEQEHPGALVYAGGDDLLALLPLEDALVVADKLQRALHENLSDEERWGSITGSGGLAIVHRHSPLQTAVRSAREAEERAKTAYERQAVVVTLLRRSGEPRSMGGQWRLGELADTPMFLLDKVDDVRSRLQAKELSSKFAYEVENEVEMLERLPRQGIQAEIKRLINRHRDPDRWNGVSPDILATELVNLAWHLPTVEGRTGLVQLGEWLLLAQFLSHGGQE
jgi:CRISPR-associated protein Cmr2